MVPEMTRSQSADPPSQTVVKAATVWFVLMRDPKAWYMPEKIPQTAWVVAMTRTIVTIHLVNLELISFEILNA
jgi:hypothetical protein